MKLLYCHDNIYHYSKSREIYSSGQFPYDYFLPLIDVFGNVSVVGRGKALCPNINIETLNRCNGAGISFKLMPNINSIKGLVNNYKTVNARVKALVRGHDAIIIRAVSDLGWLVYKHAKAMGKPIAMEMAACAWDSTWNHGSPYGRAYAPIRYYRDKTITKNADFVKYVSQNFLQERYSARGSVAVASNVRIERPSEEILFSKLQKIKERKRSERQVIGLIGTLGHKLKGIHTALAALQRVEQQEAGQFYFRVLGSGNVEPYRRKAKELGLSHCVSFDGALQTGSKVLEWLDEIDIYIQPSFQEGVPRATIEAMSRACPVIGSTAGGIPELLMPEWMHKPGDYKHLGGLISRMLRNKSKQIESARVNFECSKRYASDILMPIRTEFWEQFREFAIELKNERRDCSISEMCGTTMQAEVISGS